MPELLIDTTRLVSRLMAGWSPTGIDRVCLAYVRRYAPVTHPEYCRPNEQTRHARRIQTIPATAAGVVTNSQSTLQALSAYVADKGLPKPPAPLASVTFSQGEGWIEKEGCSDAQLATYLRHARVLLLPSFVEGYGLPLIEALSLGVPVIASNLPVFHEVAANIPDYLDPIDGTGWMNCVESFCNPASGLRAAQLVRMPEFTPPTWPAHF
jgi:glycosyltransferase involved in cell wall biosynthesis